MAILTELVFTKLDCEIPQLFIYFIMELPMITISSLEVLLSLYRLDQIQMNFDFNIPPICPKIPKISKKMLEIPKIILKFIS